MDLRASIEHVAWPAVMGGFAAELMALQWQFNASQFWSPERLRQAQFRQLELLVAHAASKVPFYAERLREADIDPTAHLTEDAWARLPVLTRRDVQRAGDKLHAPSPAAHGAISEVASGGSTGVPVHVRKTGLDNLLWNAIHIREEFWHRDDPAGTVVRLRGVPAHFPPEHSAAMNSREGLILPDWGPPASLLWKTGKMGLMHYVRPAAEQEAFLRRMQPEYIYTLPSTLRLLLAQWRGAPFKLRSVWTLSEAVDDTLREACRTVFGCRIVHNYTSAETGYLALQCPQSDVFHVQSETVLLEVIDGDGRPCKPGEIGRVVVTPLHNFAMPLLRYEIGDEAEPGLPCACGRGLPVLARIVGRIHDFATLPTGERRRVQPGHHELAAIRAIHEYQLIQRSRERIEILIVASRKLTNEEESAIRIIHSTKIGPEFHYDITYCDAIPRTPGGKLRPFISEVSAPA